MWEVKTVLIMRKERREERQGTEGGGKGGERGRGMGKGRGRGRGRVGYARDTASSDTVVWQEIPDSGLDEPPSTLSFSEQVGATTTMPDDAQPTDFFSLFFPDQVIHMLIEGTNDHAQSRIEDLDRKGQLTASYSGATENQLCQVI